MSLRGVKRSTGGLQWRMSVLSSTVRGGGFHVAPMLVLFCFLWGCAVGPDFRSPEAPTVGRYTQGVEPRETVPAVGQRQYFERGAKIAGDWWGIFQCEKLDALIKAAIASNQSLQAAQARLRQSQENLRASSGPFFPQVDGTFNTTRQKFSPTRYGGTLTSSLFTLYSATATVSYNLDIVGRTRRTVESRRAQVNYQQYELEATFLTLLGNVVNSAIAQAAYRAQIEATEQIIEFEKTQLKIAEARVRAGIIPYSNLLSLHAQLAATQATLAPLMQGLSKSHHLLATLVGRMPAEFAPPAIDLGDLTLPLHLPISLPSRLVRQRPDILAAEAQLHAASANIGVATAAMFPSLNLSATYGQNSLLLKTLFRSAGNFWDVGGDITGPIFRGGSLWAKRQAAIEAYRESLANYRQTVLDAFAQVADTLRALENDALALKAQEQSLRSAEQALHLVKASYKAGIADYLQVLIANRQYQEARINYLQARAQRYQDTAALFVALGGGWWNVKNGEETTTPPW